MNFGHNKTNLRKHLNRERNMARQRFSAIRIGNTNKTLYDMIRDPNIERVRELYETHRKQIIRPGKPGGKPIKLKREYEFANGIIGVQNVANSYLNGRPVNKSRWVGQYTPAGVKQTSNSFEIKKPVPVIAYKNGKYVGHVWREWRTTFRNGLEHRQVHRDTKDVGSFRSSQQVRSSTTETGGKGTG